MAEDHFQFSFTTGKNRSDVFAHLINPRNWWVGLYGETIAGKSEKPDDEFTFRAGDGVHYSSQRLITAEAPKKIVWLVTESNLSFLQNVNEWAGTKISFDIEDAGDKTRVTFTHIGLIPKIECYGGCSSAWTRYLENLQENLK